MPAGFSMRGAPHFEQPKNENEFGTGKREKALPSPFLTTSL
jgi:hypothetical protein